MKLARAALSPVAEGDDLAVHLHLVEGLRICVAMRAEARRFREVALVLVDRVCVEEDRGALRQLVASELHIDLGLPQGQLGRDVAVEPHRFGDARVRQGQVQQVVEVEVADCRARRLLCQLCTDLRAHLLQQLLVLVHVGHKPPDRHELVTVGRELQREHELLETFQHLLVSPALRQPEKLLEHRILAFVLLGVLHTILVATHQHLPQVLARLPDLRREQTLLVDAVDRGAHDGPRVLPVPVEHVGVGLHDVAPEGLEDVRVGGDLALHAVAEVLGRLHEDLRRLVQGLLVGEEVHGGLIEDLPRLRALPLLGAHGLLPADRRANDAAEGLIQVPILLREDELVRLPAHEDDGLAEEARHVDPERVPVPLAHVQQHLVEGLAADGVLHHRQHVRPRRQLLLPCPVRALPGASLHGSEQRRRCGDRDEGAGGEGHGEFASSRRRVSEEDGLVRAPAAAERGRGDQRRRRRAVAAH
mmetsp:Transcript_11343/g.28563  ORF Transcript_11343/g.28563 Transcript_11343/m.28563 type:complete len:474 (-) Transcript_11343:255-1676(-)